LPYGAAERNAAVASSPIGEPGSTPQEMFSNNRSLRRDVIGTGLGDLTPQLGVCRSSKSYGWDDRARRSVAGDRRRSFPAAPYGNMSSAGRCDRVGQRFRLNNGPSAFRPDRVCPFFASADQSHSRDPVLPM